MRDAGSIIVVGIGTETESIVIIPALKVRGFPLVSVSIQILLATPLEDSIKRPQSDGSILEKPRYPMEIQDIKK